MRNSPSPSAARAALTRSLVAAVALTSAVAGAVAIDAIQIPDLDTPGILVTMLPSGALAALATAAALRAMTTAGAAVATVLSCILGGLLNAPISFFLTQVVGAGEDMGDVGGLVGGTVLAALFGAIFAAPLGLLFGLAFAGPVAYVHRLRARVSIDAPDRARVALALMTLSVSTFAWVVTTGVFHLNPTTGAGPSLSAPGALPLSLAALALIVLVVSTARLALRQAWLARVRAGRVPGWAVVAATEIDTTDADLLPVTPLQRWPAPSVLVEVTPSKAEGAYRALDHRLPRALVAP